MQYTSYYHSKIGLLKIEADDIGVHRIDLIADEKENKGTENELTKKAVIMLDEYFKGNRKTFEVPLTPLGTEFQKKVWNALLTVPFGKTKSYKEIAQMIGNEKACRAVGTAIGKNPILIMIPCHRIISSDQTLGGFSAGIEIKKELLRLEGII